MTLQLPSLLTLVRNERLGLPTRGLENRCSIQLSYWGATRRILPKRTSRGNRTMQRNRVENAENEMDADLSGNVCLSFTRKYRGFDFVGFSIGRTDLGQTPTLTAKQKKQLEKGTPLVANFKTDGTKDVTLFYDDVQYAKKENHRNWAS